jgi:hypothetical protein
VCIFQFGSTSIKSDLGVKLRKLLVDVLFPIVLVKVSFLQ